MTNKRIARYSIYFGSQVYYNGVDAIAGALDTFIHELTHVWQGHNEGVVFFNYMVRSLAAQARAIISHLDRNMAYEYDTNNYLKWSDYNPEQQASIVGQWFSWNPLVVKNAGSMSSHDPRYVYIEKVIRAGNPNAPDIPSNQPPQAVPPGFSATVQTYQRMLIKKGCQIKDDGFNGKQTDKAVRDFQTRNGLRVNGHVGPKTLAKLK